jgi:hypothetical protein
LEEVGSEGGPTRAANIRAGVSQLDYGGVATQSRRLFLLVPPDLGEFWSGFFGQRAGARGAGPIGDHDTGEAEIFLPAAGADARKGHDFEVIGMGTDTEVGGGGEGGLPVSARRDGGLRIGPGKFHRWSFRHGWRLGEKTQREAAK